MTITCYACHKSFVVYGWNPTRQTAVCVTPSCGRHVHVGEAAERKYGEIVGRQVRKILEQLERLKGARESVAHLVDLAAARIEALLDVAERAFEVESQGDVVAQLGGAR